MTLLISAQDLCKSYGSDDLFYNISLEIFEDERVGLIGPNGSGKSTLLKLFMGLDSPDKGKIIQTLNAQLVYLPQQDHFDPESTVKNILFSSFQDELEESEYLYRIWEATGENFLTDLTRKVNTLSGGWRKRVAIVQALLQKPRLLMMDEPTNHLDLEGIVWLEKILKKASFAFVLVSHDRTFLENTVNSIVELNKIYPNGYFKTKGNYTEFLRRRGEFIETQLQKEKSLANKLRREEEWLQRMPKARATKSQYRIDQAEQLKLELREVNKNNMQNKKAVIGFEATDRKTKNLLETHHLTVSRNGKLVFEDLNLKIFSGLSLGLIGKNGSGKSTLISLLNETLLPDSGSIQRADNLRIVTFDQKREQLDQNQNLMHALSPTGDQVIYKGVPMHVVAWAKRFLFTRDQLHQPIHHLSGGEQARVLIANLMLQPADILLLDEPTNDLDIPTLEVLEDSLDEFPGAIVLITHDRFLLDRLSDTLLYLEGNGKTEFFSSYAQYCKEIDTGALKEIKTSSDPVSSKKKIHTMSYEEQRELSQIPKKIQKAEIEVKMLEEQLENFEIQSDAVRLADLCNKITAGKDKIMRFFDRWEELEQKK